MINIELLNKPEKNMPVFAPIVIKVSLKIKGVETFLFNNPELSQFRFYILDEKVFVRDEDQEYLKLKGLSSLYPSRYFAFTKLNVN